MLRELGIISVAPQTSDTATSLAVTNTYTREFETRNVLCKKDVGMVINMFQTY